MIVNPGDIRTSININTGATTEIRRLMFKNNTAPVIFYLDGNIKNNNTKLSATPPHHKDIVEWLKSCTTDSKSFTAIPGYDDNEKYFTNP